MLDTLITSKTRIKLLMKFFLNIFNSQIKWRPNFYKRKWKMFKYLENYRECIIGKHDIIPNDSGKKLQAMVGFRNIAVHEYQNIDNEILKSILQNNLRDIEEYYKIILAKFE